MPNFIPIVDTITTNTLVAPYGTRSSCLTKNVFITHTTRVTTIHTAPKNCSTLTSGYQQSAARWAGCHVGSHPGDVQPWSDLPSTYKAASPTAGDPRWDSPSWAGCCPLWMTHQISVWKIKATQCFSTRLWQLQCKNYPLLWLLTKYQRIKEEHNLNKSFLKYLSSFLLSK